MHSVTIGADSHGLIDESDESDNSYSRTFTVTPRIVNKPDLAPYTPDGWSCRGGFGHSPRSRMMLRFAMMTRIST